MPGAGHAILASLHDVELCARAAAGERRAFGELARRHGSAIRHLLRRMGAQGAEADDVAQDALLAAFERIAEFRGEGTFAGWVKRIAARQYLRRLQREKRLAGYVAEEARDEAEGGAAAGAGGDTERRLDLDEALKALSRPERMCVSMCYGAGLSHAEAADALNLPLGTVKSHVKRGLEKLRTRLAPPPEQADGAAVEGKRGNG
ncbi:sigma-70 family RNA polymerase sigma factor [Phenylobacterium sp.]|uniref:RNA polymerase sigma factor n=1 Tax=Phenylobacterium sp. TaxID=1871053 RepID=UPI00301C2847